MIKLENLNKYYNKKKSNEIHVLKDISIVFEKTGLVALFGKSGCGKTTLLNCLGGIDNFDSGSYFINETKLSSGKTSLINKYKTKNIGFIFQDYKLIENDSVEDNILLALKIAQIPLDIEKVNIVLSAVGMAKYNKRKVRTLSGGQKQRIAIARALVINPSVILADEPTGNLDRQNSLQVLQILKAISKNTLVVLVSHEKELVKMFANRVIEIANATIISDKLNEVNSYNIPFEQNETINHTQKIDLQTLYKKYLVDDDVTITLYYDKSAKLSNLNFVIEGNKLTLLNNDYCIVNKEIVSSSKNVQQEKQVKSMECPFSLSSLSDLNNTNGIIKKDRFRLLSLVNMHNKMIKIILLISAILTAIATSFINEATKIDYANFQMASYNMLSLTTSASSDIKMLENIRDNEHIHYVLPYDIPMQFSFTQRSIIQGNVYNPEVSYLSLMPLPISLIDGNNLIYGRMPQSAFEVVLDRFYVDKLFAQGQGLIGHNAIFGITSEKGFIGGELLIYPNQTVTITGISDTASPTIYMHNDLLNSASLQRLSGIMNSVFTENLTDFTDTSITFDTNDEIYISQAAFIAAEFNNKDINYFMFNDKQYKVKGYYVPNNKTNDNQALVISSQELIRITNKQLSQKNNILIVAKDIEMATYFLEANNISARNMLQDEIDLYLTNVRSEMTLLLMFIAIIILAVTILYNLGIKANILDRKEELTIKISLGMSSSKIYREFILNSVILTLIYAIPSYLMTQVVIQTILSRARGLLPMMSVTLPNVLWGLFGLIIIPILITSMALSKYAFSNAKALLKSN